MTVRTALTLDELGVAMSRSDEDRLRMRMVLDFIDGYSDVGVAERAALIEIEPKLFDARWDAFLAALADHVAYEAPCSQPPWAEAPARFLTWFWFPVNLASVVAEAIATCPATFMRHGVMITPDLFSRA